VIAAVALSLTLAATSTVTSGTGWRYGNGIDHLDTTYWSIQFYDEYSRDRLTFYMNLVSDELEAHTDVKFNVTTVINPNSDICPGHTQYGGHRLIVRLDPNSTRSNATQCNVNGAADSSRALFSETNWFSKTRDGSKYAYRRNVVSHEIGHSVGLGHPDWTGTESDPSGCTLSGTDPLMCGAYWGGYGGTPDHYSAHKYAPYDISGLKHLVLNRP